MQSTLYAMNTPSRRCLYRDVRLRTAAIGAPLCSCSRTVTAKSSLFWAA